MEITLLIALACAIAGALLAGGCGGVLVYHWFRFAMNPFVSMVATAVYAVVAALLILALFASFAML